MKNSRIIKKVSQLKKRKLYYHHYQAFLDQDNRLVTIIHFEHQISGFLYFYYYCTGRTYLIRIQLILISTLSVSKLMLTSNCISQKYVIVCYCVQTNFTR